MKTEFVRVEINEDQALTANHTGHQKVIRDFADLGYHYAGFIPLNFWANGKIREMDLVFQQ